MSSAQIGSLMEKEIREQPAALADRAEPYFQFLSKLRTERIEMVVIAARGSSDHAALYARYLFEISLGIPVSLAAPSVITKYNADLRYPQSLCVGISQSGAAPDVAEVIGHMRRSGHLTLGITNTEDSRLTREAEHTLQLGVGPESSVAATKTYTASLLAMYQLARALGADLANPAGHLPTDAWLEQCLSAADALVGPMIRRPILFALSRGYEFCTSHETALKLMECALLPCKAYSTADFEHGPKALAGPESAAVIYGEVPEGIGDHGCEIVHAPPGPAGPLGPIHSIIFGQWLALLAARARRLDPDRPRNLKKVTETL